MSDLIDTTEMYLRTIFELTEEGVRPMRARIAERLRQSGPTVSQTVARMQRDGLVKLDLEDRHLLLTPLGAELATRVMRKHRLAECLLVDVIGLPWEEVHPEACRWEHVMSEAVERRLFALLGQPSVSPFGNPIPGLSELVAPAPEPEAGGPAGGAAGPGGVPGDGPAPGPVGGPSALPGVPLSRIADEGGPRLMTILRIGEVLQSDESLMSRLRQAGAVPGGLVPVQRAGAHVRIGAGADLVELRLAQAVQVVVVAPAE